MQNSSTTLLKKDDIIISARGTVGALAMVPYPMAFNQSCYGIKAKEGIVDKSYLYYTLKFNVEKLKKNTHGSVFDTITRDTFSYIEINLPELETQKGIAKILSSIDDKIELNNAINHNLQQQVFALYRQMFVNSPNDNRQTCRADEYFDISIGKTPPRKEPEWFKTVRADNVVWVSIADMGNSGLFIDDSSEYLSPDAVKNSMWL